MKDSKIEWCAHTFNPWHGCVKVSAGCAHCYAETLSHRWGNDVWGVDKPRKMMSESYWHQPVKWNKAAEVAVVRARVFCASMADVFESRDDLFEPRLRLFELIERTPWLDWLLLTKRPENILARLPYSWRENPLPNVWLGTSVENQEQADKRIPHLLMVPAAIRFLSAEPLLGPVDLSYWLVEPETHCGKCGLEIIRGRGNTYAREKELLGSCVRCDQKFGEWANQLHWVIVGGESGPGARPMHPAWARSLRDQCEAAGVPFLFKQWGNWFPRDQWEHNPELILPDDDVAYRNGPHTIAFDDIDGSYPLHNVGKKKAGRLLDGVEHNGYPNVEVLV